MKFNLSISNIAWNNKEDSEIYELMQNNNFNGLEIAPSRIWEKPYEQKNTALQYFQDTINKNSIKITAFQSLLFGHPEFSIFQDEVSRIATLDHLKKNIILARKLGAKALIFGSPKNRLVGNMPKKEAYKIAISFFRELGEFAIENQTFFCIEPNPDIYGGDFILTTQEAIQLVKDVHHSGFKLNVDLGTIIANNEDLESTLIAALPYAGHIHISEPFLEKIEKNKNRHEIIKKILTDYNYNLALSIEMKNAGPGAPNIENVKESLIFINKIYNG